MLYLFLPFNVAWNWLIILHYFFSGVTTYLLLKHLRATPAASFAGAAAFVFSGYLLSLNSLVTHLFAVSWFPLVLLSFLKHLETARARYIVVAAVCLCMVFLAGAPEILIMTVIVLVLLAFFGSSFVRGRLTPYQGLKALCLLCLLFCLLSAVQLLPFLELKSMSIRQGGLSYWEATLWSFGFRDFIQFFVDDAFGTFRNLDRYWQNQAWLKSVYMGIAPFVLSMLFFLSKDRRRPLFLAVMLLSLLLALGGNTPFWRLLYHIPPFNGLRYPVKFLFLFVFVLSLTAGLGLDSLRAGSEAADGRMRVAAQAIFFAGFFLALLWAGMNIFHARVFHFLDASGFKPDAYNVLEDNLHNIKRFLLFSFLFCSCLLVYFRTRRPALLHLLIALLFLDIFLANFGYFRTAPWQTYIAPPPFAKALATGTSPDRYFVDASATDELYAFPQNRAAMAPAYAPLFGLYAIGGSEVMKVAREEAFVDMLKKCPSLGEASRLLEAAGIRYVISPERITDRRFRPVKSIYALSAKRAGKVLLRLYEYRDYPGRLFLVGRARFLASDSEAASALVSRAPEAREEFLLSGGVPRLADIGAVSGQARFTSYGPNRVVIDYRSDRSCFLYLSDTYYPGWRAYVDGERTPIYRANLAFRAIRVPQGTHTVVFRYVPLSFYGGLALTLIGVGLSLVLIKRDRQDRWKAMSNERREARGEQRAIWLFN